MQWLTGLNLLLISVFVAFTLGVVFSQKVKDWLTGVPSAVRSDLTSVEGSVLSSLKTAQANVLLDLKAKVAVPAPPVVQVAPPVPVPHA